MTFKDYIDSCAGEELKFTHEWAENLENVTDKNGKLIKRLNDV